MSLSVITTYGEMSMQYSVDLLKVCQKGCSNLTYRIVYIVACCKSERKYSLPYKSVAPVTPPPTPRINYTGTTFFCSSKMPPTNVRIFENFYYAFVFFVFYEFRHHS